MPDDLKPASPPVQHAFTAAEAASIARGRAEIEAGLGIDDDDVEAWLDRLEQEPDAALPVSRNTPDHR